MTIAKKAIHGYTVEIEPNEDRAGVSCYVSKGRYSGSLAMLEGEGYLLHNSTDEEHNVKPEIIESIRAFAEKHGY